MIGELKESSLHDSLKRIYADQTGGTMEYEVDGYVVDIKSEHEIIEIQTGNFSNIHKKLLKLMDDGHRVRLVYPLVVEKTIRLFAEDGETVVRERKSPIRRGIAFAGTELMRIPQAAAHPLFSCEIVSVKILEERVDDGSGSWRRKGVSIRNRQLLEIKDAIILENRESFNILLPETLPDQFTNKELAGHASITYGQAAKLSWFLRKIGNLEEAGKNGRSMLFRIRLVE